MTRTCFSNRLTTFLAMPQQDIDQYLEGHTFLKLLFPMVARFGFHRRGRRSVPSPANGAFAELVEVLGDTGGSG